MPSVYIETTIPSFYHSTRKSAQAMAWRAQTRLWWDHYRSSYQLVTSEAVLTELRGAPSDRSSPRLNMLRDLPLLDIDSEVERIAAQYISHRLMPGEAGLDAVHVALASRHAIDFVLTWNCTHIANANKARHLAVINTRLGLSTPIMATPYNLTNEPSR